MPKKTRCFFLERHYKMHLSTILSIAFFTMALVLTTYFWIDRIRGTNAILTESFDNPPGSLKDSDLAVLTNAGSYNPTDDDASKAYKTLLQYTKNDFGKGIKFVKDFGKRFFGKNVPIREDLDVETLMNNYSSPLQVA